MANHAKRHACKAKSWSKAEPLVSSLFRLKRFCPDFLLDWIGLKLRNGWTLLSWRVGYWCLQVGMQEYRKLLCTTISSTQWGNQLYELRIEQIYIYILHAQRSYAWGLISSFLIKHASSPICKILASCESPTLNHIPLGLLRRLTGIFLHPKDDDDQINWKLTFPPMLTDAPDSAKLFWSEDLTDCQPDPENQVMPKPSNLKLVNV